MSMYIGLNERFYDDDPSEDKLDSEATEFTEETAEEGTLIPDDAEG